MDSSFFQKRSGEDDASPSQVTGREMLDELSANCRAKGGAAKILEQLRFAVAIGDAHDHEAMDKHEFREYCADLVGSGSQGFVKIRRQIVQYVLAIPSARADRSAHGRHGRREKPAMRQAKLPEHPTGGVTWATLVLAMPIHNRAMEYHFESELAKHGLEDLINTRTKEGNSILHYVAFIGCKWACRILLAKSELRLLVAERNNYGFHAPALAVLFDNDEVETLLYAWFHASRDAVDRKVNGNIRYNVRMSHIKRRSQMEQDAKSGTSHVHNSANRAHKKEAAHAAHRASSGRVR